jgi:hypothetical protein
MTGAKKPETALSCAIHGFFILRSSPVLVSADAGVRLFAIGAKCRNTLLIGKLKIYIIIKLLRMSIGQFRYLLPRVNGLDHPKRKWSEKRKADEAYQVHTNQRVGQFGASICSDTGSSFALLSYSFTQASYCGLYEANCFSCSSVLW